MGIGSTASQLLGAELGPVEVRQRRIAESLQSTNIIQPQELLFQQSYEILLKQLYGTERTLVQTLSGPVQLPEYIIINELRVNFVPFQQIGPSFWSKTKMRAFS